MKFENGFQKALLVLTIFLLAITLFSRLWANGDGEEVIGESFHARIIYPYDIISNKEFFLEIMNYPVSERIQRDRHTIVRLDNISVPSYSQFEFERKRPYREIMLERKRAHECFLFLNSLLFPARDLRIKVINETMGGLIIADIEIKIGKTYLNLGEVMVENGYAIQTDKEINWGVRIPEEFK